jgi:hypothetical protein
LKITADYREEASGLIDLLRNEDIVVEVRKVLHGDYIINGFVTIERRTVKDFLISIVDGRLSARDIFLKREISCRLRVDPREAHPPADRFARLFGFWASHFLSLSSKTPNFA